MPQPDKSEPQVIYSELVVPGPSVFLASALVIPAVSFMLWPFAPALGIAAGLVLELILMTFLVLMSPKVVLSTTNDLLHLSVDRASINSIHFSKARLIQRSDQRLEKGPALDARAFTRFQVGAKDLVKLEITDSNDPTPYWLFSTRRGSRLVALLNNKP